MFYEHIYLLQIAPKPFMTKYCRFFTFRQMIFAGYFWSKKQPKHFHKWGNFLNLCPIWAKIASNFEKRQK